MTVSCPLCGAVNATCGEQGTPHTGIIFGKAAPMSGTLKDYEVEVNGVKTTLRLNDADAKARGLDVPTKEAAKPANKSRTAANK